MRMFLTEGMFGRCLEQIGPEFKDFQEAMKELYAWKNNKMTQKFYKIEKYDRIISNKEKHETAIDFGDYSYFMLLTNCEDRDVKTIEDEMTEEDMGKLKEEKQKEAEEMFNKASPSDFIPL